MKSSLVWMTAALSVYTSNGYELLNDAMRTWEEAQTACQSTFGTDLASIHSADDWKAVTAIAVGAGQDCWIGFHRFAEDLSVWKWIDGTPADFGTDYSGGVAPWYANEPNNYGGYDWRNRVNLVGTEYCAEVYAQHEGQWNDIRCDWRNYAICNSPTAEVFECSAISSSDACMVETDCLWLSFTNPPRCGSMDKCEDHCEACSIQDCANGAGGNDACEWEDASEWNSMTEQCVGTLCDNNCAECNMPNCELSFAAPTGCIVDVITREDCFTAPKWISPRPTASPTTQPIEPRDSWIPWVTQLVAGDTLETFGWQSDELMEYYAAEKLFGKTCVIRRECPNCIESHQVIYYKRIANDCHKMVDVGVLMLTTWQSWFMSYNYLNDDFLLTNNEDIAMDTITQSFEDCNGECWEYCNYSGHAFGECGPTGPVDGTQFYCDDDENASKLCKSVRWSVLY